MTTKRTFSSTVDERLMKTLEEARAVKTGMPDETKAKPVAVAAYTYVDNQVPLSQLLTFGDGTTSDIPVPLFKDEDWHESVRQFIPDPDEFYVFDRDATEAAIVAIRDGDTMLLHGPKGSGKTTLPRELCARIRMPYIRVNSRLDMESGAIFGANSVSGGELKWNDGPIVELGIHGGLYCQDEISRTPSGINAALMGVLERNGIIYLSDKPGTSAEKTIKPHKWFRFFATDNTELQGDTTGKYVGTNVQDEAMIDRFATTIKLGYLKPAHEEAVIMRKNPHIATLHARRMVQMANLIRAAYDGGNLGFTMSPRGLLEWGRKLAQWDNNAKAFKLSFYNKLIPSDRRVVAEFYHTTFSENLSE